MKHIPLKFEVWHDAVVRAFRGHGDIVVVPGPCGEMHYWFRLRGTNALSHLLEGVECTCPATFEVEGAEAAPIEAWWGQFMTYLQAWRQEAYPQDDLRYVKALERYWWPLAQHALTSCMAPRSWPCYPVASLPLVLWFSKEIIRVLSMQGFPCMVYGTDPVVLAYTGKEGNHAAQQPDLHYCIVPWVIYPGLLGTIELSRVGEAPYVVDDWIPGSTGITPPALTAENQRLAGLLTRQIMSAQVFSNGTLLIGPPS